MKTVKLCNLAQPSPTLCEELCKQQVAIGPNTSIGGNCYFNGPVMFFQECYLYSIKMDAYSYANQRANIQHSSIGRYCSIGTYCEVGMPYHNYKAFSSSTVFSKHSAFQVFSGPISYNPQWIAAKDNILSNHVTIEHDVWVGSHVNIPSDVTISTGAVIGAGAVVKRDVPPYAIIDHTGKHIKNRFSDEVIADLLASQWWLYDIPRMLSQGMIDPSFQESPQGLLELMRNSDTSQWLRIEDNWQVLLLFSAEQAMLTPIDPRTDQRFSQVNLPD